MPDLLADYLRPLPEARPAGLRSRRVKTGTKLWRLAAAAPADWTWKGFSRPRYRFDPESGTFRTRYAATDVLGAFRERYQATGWLLPRDHAGHHLTELVATRSLLVLDLRTEANLDALGVDDQISTGQQAQIWTTCQRLSDAARRWWPDLDAIVYRSRTTPTISTNYAFFDSDPFTTQSWTLAARPELLDDLVLRQGFTVGWHFDGTEQPVSLSG